MLPLILLALHWLAILFTGSDPRNEGQTRTGNNMAFWILPFISLMVNGLLYATALGAELSPASFVSLLTGPLFMVIGNLLPKVKQNSTIGLKFHWALQDEENWNATHRFGGKLWVIGGLLITLTVFLQSDGFMLVMLLALLAIAFIPMLYSYLFYRKRKASGAEFAPRSQAQKKWNRRASFIVVPILIFCGIMLFTGEVEVSFAEESFTVKAAGWPGRTVAYESIEGLEYRQQDDVGSRTGGVGSPRLLAGQFQNSEFGSYTRYSYTQCPHCVVLQVEGKTVVINGADETATRAIYDTLLQKMGG